MFRNLNLSELIEIRKAKYCVRSEPVESYLDLSDFGIVDPNNEDSGTVSVPMNVKHRESECENIQLCFS